MRACRRETFRSVRRIVLPSLRPIVISSRIRGTTVVFPSSSWITSLNIVDYVPAATSGQNPTSHHWLYQSELRENNAAPTTSCHRAPPVEQAGQPLRVVDRPRPCR